MKRPRVSSVAIAILIVAECLFLAFLVAFGWTFRSSMLNPGDPEIAIRTRTVVINAVWFVLNVLAALAYVSRRSGFGRYTILLMLAIDVVNSLFASVLFVMQSDPGTALGWGVEALVPAAAFVLILSQDTRGVRPATGG